MKANEYSEVASWIEGFGGTLDSFDFISGRFSLADWISISEIFRPSFIEVDGCILWDRSFERQNFDTWMTELSGDRTRVETVLNRLRIWQLIEYSESAEDTAAASTVAESVAQCWKLRLSEQFPDVSFNVATLESEDGPVVEFNVIRH